MRSFEPLALSAAQELLISAALWALDPADARAGQRVRAAVAGAGGLHHLAGLVTALDQVQQGAGSLDALRQALTDAARAERAANGVRTVFRANPREDISGQWWQA